MNISTPIEDFINFFEAFKVDQKHAYDDESKEGPLEPPLIVNINGESVGCISLRTFGNTSDCIELVYIYMYTNKKGDGSIILNKLCSIADNHKVKLKLEACPLHRCKDKIPQESLFAFYERFGFVKSDIPSSKRMTRSHS